MKAYATCDNDGSQHVYIDEEPIWEPYTEYTDGSYGGWWRGENADYEVPAGTYAIGHGEKIELVLVPLDGKTCRFCGNQDLSVEREPGTDNRYYVYCACCESRGPVARDKETVWRLYNGNA